MDGIDSQGKILTPLKQTLISENIKDKSGQGSRPQYYARKRTPPPPPPEEETPEETGEPERLIDIKV